MNSKEQWAVHLVVSCQTPTQGHLSPTPFGGGRAREGGLSCTVILSVITTGGVSLGRPMCLCVFQLLQGQPACHLTPNLCQQQLPRERETHKDKPDTQDQSSSQHVSTTAALTRCMHTDSWPASL